ncbi:MAG: MFS transporter [Deltaproteobacteria bacterium]|nr:MFS transporter [Deltaproteobacteria bacterium]
MTRIPFYNGLLPSSYTALVLLCCLITFGSYFGSYMRMPIVPIHAKFMGADSFQVGLINSSFLLMAGLLSLPFGMLSDLIGRKILILCGLLISAGTSFLFYFSNSPLEMAAIYLLFGIGLAAFAPTMMSFVTEVSPPSHLGRAYGWYTMALYGGMSMGPAFAGYLAQYFGLLQVFLFSGGLVFLLFWVVYFFLPRARLVAVRTHRNRITRDAARSVLRNRPLFSCWLVTLGGCFGLGMFVTFGPLHAHERGISIGQIGIIFATQAICNALSRIPFGYLSDKVRNRATLVIPGLLGYALSIVCFGLSANMMAFLFSSCLMGITMGIAFTAVGALISEVAAPGTRGLAMGGYNTCVYFGMMLSSVGMGAWIRTAGFERAFLLTAFINLTAAVVFWLTSGLFGVLKGVGETPSK